MQILRISVSATLDVILKNVTNDKEISSFLFNGDIKSLRRNGIKRDAPSVARRAAVFFYIFCYCIKFLKV